MSHQETRPWGSFTVLEDTAHYKVKRLDVNPGQRLSYQNHQKRDEHWTVVMGVATVTLDGKILKIPAGKDVFIPKTSKHRLANEDQSSLVVIEVQTGEYFGEDDIQRFEDDYRRVDS